MREKKPKIKNEKKNKQKDKNYEGVIDLSIDQKGLGDFIEDVLKSPLVKPITEVVKKLVWDKDEDCGCDKRKEKLNKLFPMKKPKCFSKKQYDEFKTIYIKNGKITNDNKIKIENLHSDIFSHKLTRLCNSCGETGKIINQWYKELNSVYLIYTE